MYCKWDLCFHILLRCDVQDICWHLSIEHWFWHVESDNDGDSVKRRNSIYILPTTTHMSYLQDVGVQTALDPCYMMMVRPPDNEPPRPCNRSRLGYTPAQMKFMYVNAFLRWQLIGWNISPFFRIIAEIIELFVCLFLPRDASAERGYEIACRPSVCLSVTFRYRVQIRWNSSKIISRPNRLGSMCWLTPNIGDLVQREHP